MIAFLIALPFYILPYVLIIGIVITVHELGHFLAAKAVNTKIDQFSIGFGKALFRRTDRSGVEWRLSMFPIGGFVRFAGDDNAASIPDQDDLADMRLRTFWSASARPNCAATTISSPCGSAR